MIFEAYIPTELDPDEAAQYANRVSVDGDGIDLGIDGETISASFQGQNNLDIAIALLEDEFKHAEPIVHLIQRMGGYTEQGMQELGYAYIKAAQIMRLSTEVPVLV